jgi:nucleoside-diphosphate-sugar epimerase
MSTRIIEEDVRAIVKEVGESIHQLENKKILITGAGGMIGSYLVYALMYANKHILKNPATLYLVIRTKKEPFGKDAKIHYLHIDIAKETPSLRGVHYMVHAASKAAPKIYMVDRIDTMNANILGLYHLLEICDQQLKSFLYFSSCDVYGEPNTNQLIKEDYVGTTDHLSARSCYAEAKRACETICINYFWEKELPIKIARIFHTFGPGLDLYDGRSFSDFTRFGLEKKDITIKGDSKKKRTYLYVKDTAIMLLKLLLSGENGHIYNIGNKNNLVSIGGFANLFKEAFNKRYKREIHVVEDVKGNISYYQGAVNAIRPDMHKFKRDFNYEPKTGIKEAVERTVEHYLSIK